MTFAPTPTAHRCDRILALIDEALGEAQTPHVGRSGADEASRE